MDVTVSICTWNNSRRLRVTLDSLAACAVPPGCRWEVVLVNNNCTDDTDSVARDFLERLPLVYVREPVQGLSRARNAALRAAKGELLIFADDDVRFARDWLGAYFRAWREMPEGHFFGGPVESDFELAAPDPELLRFAPFSVRGLAWGPAARMLDPHEQFLAANWAFPRKALAEGGAFDESRGLGASASRISVGEERDLQLRLRRGGWTPWYLPEALVHHFVPAEKCSLRHIVQRAEAAEYEGARRSLDDGAPRVAGIPRWLIRRLVEAWVSYVGGRLMGRRAIGPYVTLRKCQARIRAHRELRRQGALRWDEN
jgi:glycosyltransferase involved in cell wall biosynthesis